MIYVPIYDDEREMATDRQDPTAHYSWVLDQAVQLRQAESLNTGSMTTSVRGDRRGLVSRTDPDSTSSTMGRLVIVPNECFVNESRRLASTESGSTNPDRPRILESTLLKLLRLDFFHNWKKLNVGWLCWMTGQVDPQGVKAKRAEAVHPKRELESSLAAENDFIDWDIQIEKPPKRAQRTVRMRFIQHGRRQPVIRDNPLD